MYRSREVYTTAVDIIAVVYKIPWLNQNPSGEMQLRSFSPSPWYPFRISSWFLDWHFGTKSVVSSQRTWTGQVTFGAGQIHPDDVFIVHQNICHSIDISIWVYKGPFFLRWLCAPKYLKLLWFRTQGLNYKENAQRSLSFNQAITIRVHWRVQR